MARESMSYEIVTMVLVNDFKVASFLFLYDLLRNCCGKLSLSICVAQVRI